jgi:hypothetical protein
MKSKLTQRRYRAPKRSVCGMCKPQQRGWADKKTPADLRTAIRLEQQIQDWERSALLSDLCHLPSVA